MSLFKNRSDHPIARILFFLLFVCALSFLTFGTAHRARAASWTYYRALTVTSSVAIASGTQADFPMLVSSTFPDWASVAHGGVIQNLVTAPNGGQKPADLVFATSTADCLNGNYLDFETESYSSSTGSLVDWVKVPMMQAGTVIYACYDNASVLLDESNPGGTWSNGYAGVWHMNDNSSSTLVAQSTVNPDEVGVATANTNIRSTNGKIATALSFNGTTDWIYVGTTTNLYSNPITISAWVNPNNDANYFYQRVLQEGNSTNQLDGGYDIEWNNGGSGFGCYGPDGFYGVAWSTTSGTSVCANATSSLNEWHHVTFTYNGSSGYTYVDGVPGSLYSGTTLTAPTPYQFAIGDQGNAGANPFSGAIEEVHVSSVARSSSWVLTEYNNQNVPSVFYSTGSQTDMFPSVTSFSISSGPLFVGDSIAFSWNTTGASTISLMGSGINLTTTTLSGTTSVIPAATGTLAYTLTATNQNGTSTATTSVTVLPTSTMILTTTTTLTTTTMSVYATASSTATSTISIPSGAATPTLDLNALTSSGTATLPGPITIVTPSTTVSLPANLAITAATTSWDGILNLPQPSVSYAAPTPSAGHTDLVSSAIEIGLPTAKVSFSLPVEIVFPGAAGSLVGWSMNGVLTTITASCTSLTNPVLGADGDCTGNQGNDLVVWTRHFTTFLVWTETASASASSAIQVGGGGSAYYLRIGTGSPVTATTSVSLSLYGTMAYTMQVSSDPSFTNAPWIPYRTSLPWTLDATTLPQTLYARFRAVSGTIVGSASAFTTVSSVTSSSPAATSSPLLAELASLEQQLNILLVRAQGTAAAPSFSRNLRLDMTGSDVRSLQAYLNAHGFPVASVPRPGSLGHETDFFGPATMNALIKFQTSHGIPATGFFGPITRGKLGSLY